MIQLDLFSVEPLTAPYPSDRPLRSMEAIRREQENERRLQRHHQRQERLPPSLRRDLWTLYKDLEGYRLFHTYTALETDAHTTPSEAIREALHMAAFFGLLPAVDLAWMLEENPLLLGTPPRAIAVRLRYGPPFAEARWYAEYRQRHPAPPTLTKALAQTNLLEQE